MQRPRQAAAAKKFQSFSSHKHTHKTVSIAVLANAVLSKSNRTRRSREANEKKNWKRLKIPNVNSNKNTQSNVICHEVIRFLRWCLWFAFRCLLFARLPKHGCTRNDERHTLEFHYCRFESVSECAELVRAIVVLV